jgi:hypothetical protein
MLEIGGFPTGLEMLASNFQFPMSNFDLDLRTNTFCTLTDFTLEDYSVLTALPLVGRVGPPKTIAAPATTAAVIANGRTGA